MIREATSAPADVKSLVSTGLRAVRTRLELLAIEVQEEKAWAVRLVVAAVATLYLLTLALVFGSVALVLFASEENRPAILAILAGVFLVSGIAGVSWVRSTSRSRGPLFEDTIAVLKGDEQGMQEMMRGTGD